MKFRPDIDGLRAVAVLLVVAFHAKLAVAPGGYVGVDVFLVISGFLITGILVNLIDSGQLSLKNFLLRRLRRLMPAAVVMVAAVLIAGWAILGPHDLRRLAGSSIAVLTLTPNFFFWAHQGYFADQFPEPALLHTWSLGLEEQFYLLFPPALLLLPARNLRVRVTAFTLAAVASFVSGVWLTGAHPGAAFYLLPARGWEFLTGGLLALRAGAGACGPRGRAALGIGGLALIFAAALALTPLTPYPGVAALLPVAGTCAAIGASSGAQTLAGRLLSARWLVAVGGASYSLYLWHWPVLTLARYYLGRGLTALETAAALALIAILTYLSRRWVERPFRYDAARGGSPRRLGAALVVGVVVLAASLVILDLDGAPSRLSAQALRFESAALTDEADANDCHRGPPAAGTLCTLAVAAPGAASVLVWGDSHANAIAPQVRELGMRHGSGVIQATYSSCPPLLEVDVAHTHGSRCREFNRQVLQAIRARGIHRVLLAAFWTDYLPQHAEPALARLLDPYSRTDDLGGGDAAQNTRNFSQALQRTVRALGRLGVQIWILGQVPTQDVLVPLALSRAAQRGRDYAAAGVSLASYRRSQGQVDALLHAQGDAVPVIDPAQRMCLDGICRSSAAGEALYIDTNHLSAAGAALLAPQLEAVFH